MRRLAIALIALAVPCMLSAQQDTARMRGRNDTSRAPARTENVSRGSIGRSMGRANMGLTSDQVQQLQTALKQDDCDPGPVDGILGPRTRRAMACARRKNNVNGSNTNDLLRSLNLDFTVQDSTGMGGMMRSGRRSGYRMKGTGNDTTTMLNDTLRTRTSRHSRAGGMHRMGRDSTMRTRNDSTMRRGRGTRPDTGLRKP